MPDPTNSSPCSLDFPLQLKSTTGPEVIKNFFMLNSTEHGISTAHKKTKIPTNEICWIKVY